MLSRPRLSRLSAVLCAGWLAVGGTMASAERVTLFAAASLQEALLAVGDAFEAETGHELVISFAGSSALARQIEYGAPADVFLSANVNWVSHLISKGMLIDESKKELIGNRLSLVVSAEIAGGAFEQNISDLLKILKNGRLAMALVEAVPAGIYGREALQSLGLWQEVQPRVAEVDNVRSALALVALGEAAAGVVYATDALAEPRVHEVAQFPPDSHTPIVYPAAIVRGRDRPEVNEFMSFLQGDVAIKAFVSHGFTILEQNQ